MIGDGEWWRVSQTNVKTRGGPFFLKYIEGAGSRKQATIRKVEMELFAYYLCGLAGRLLVLLCGHTIRVVVSISNCRSVKSIGPR